MSEHIKVRIHYTLPSGDEDSFVLEGDNIEILRQRADEGVKARSGTDPWSEELGDGR